MQHCPKWRAQLTIIAIVALCVALDKLGYKTYHMNEVRTSLWAPNFKFESADQGTQCLARPNYFFPLWIEALNAKFRGRGKPFGRLEFDKVLGEYDVSPEQPPAATAHPLLKNTLEGAI